MSLVHHQGLEDYHEGLKPLEIGGLRRRPAQMFSEKFAKAHEKPMVTRNAHL